MKEKIIGRKFKSNQCNDFTVLNATNQKQGKFILYLLEFDEVNGVKYKCLKRMTDIKIGKVKNPYYPSYSNVGYQGEPDKKLPYYQTALERWTHMIGRCYNKNDNKFSSYGAIGIQVCERWKCFAKYLEDFDKLKGFDNNNLNNLQIDKDILSKELGFDNRIYSPQTCMFVNNKTNSKERDDRQNQRFRAVSPDGEVFYSNNQKEFERLHNLTNGGICEVLSGRQKSHKKWKFEKIL